MFEIKCVKKPINYYLKTLKRIFIVDKNYLDQKSFHKKIQYNLSICLGGRIPQTHRHIELITPLFALG